MLQKAFWGGERKFLEPLMRFTRGDVRGPYGAKTAKRPCDTGINGRTVRRPGAVSTGRRKARTAPRATGHMSIVLTQY
jgi:hypothetical protein